MNRREILSVTPNDQLHRSVNSRLRRLLPPGELGRWTSPHIRAGEVCTGSRDELVR